LSQGLTLPDDELKQKKNKKREYHAQNKRMQSKLFKCEASKKIRLVIQYFSKTRLGESTSF
jgi:hypothetical protein